MHFDWKRKVACWKGTERERKRGNSWERRNRQHAMKRGVQGAGWTGKRQKTTKITRRENLKTLSRGM